MMWKSLAGAAVAGLMMAGPASAASSYPNLYEKAAQEGEFETFLKAVKAADIDAALRGSDNYTVLAPTDAAFASLPAGTLDRLLKPDNRDELTALLKNHIIPGTVFASTWANEKLSVPTKGGAEILVDGTGNPFRINEADVVKLNVAASNGMIHAVDEVLLSPSS